MKRIHIFISGLVQGVAFRHHTLKTARSLGISGWVRNLEDGRVEALIEGDDAAVDAMQTWLRTGPPSARVTHLETTQEPYSGSYFDFKIAY
jgi:acylphosphatase